MALIDTLSWKTAVDLKGLQTGLTSASRLIDQVERRLATIRVPSLEIKGGQGVDGGSSAADLAAAFTPAANQIRGTLQGAFGGLEPTFRRLSVQIEALTGASLAHFRRLDSEVRFPMFMAGIAKVRNFVRDRFVDMEGDPTRFAKVADRALGGLAFGAKLKNQLESLRSFGSNSAREVAKLKLPPINAAPAVAGVAALKGSADRATSSFKGLGLQIAGALGFVGVGYKAVGFLKEAIKDASDLNEVTNKTNVILGDGAPAVRKFAEQMAKDFGSSKAATLEVSTELAGLGKGLGNLKGDKLAEFATNLTRLASDVSSIDNKSLKEVGDAFRVGLSGEQSDVLKGLGVVLTETTVKSYALAHGLGKVGEDLSEEAKLMARAGILTEKLAFANGDLARTINDPANAYRRFTGQVENLGASLGGIFLPVVNEVLAGLNGMASTTDDALGRSKSAFADWATSSAFAVSTVSLYLQNWDDSVKLAALSASQGIENFSARFTNQFAKIGDEISKAFESPFEFLGNELNHLWLNVQNIFHNIQELVSKGINADFVDINEGWKQLDDMANRRPERKLVAADNSKEMADIAARIEGRRAVKPDLALPAPIPRPDATVAGINAKAMQKAQDELESFAKSFKDKIRTPLEEYGEALKKAKEAFDKGLITQAQLDRADSFARREAGFGETKFSSASELGTREGYSLLISAMTGRGNDFQKEIARSGREQVSELRQLNKQFSAKNEPPATITMKV